MTNEFIIKSAFSATHLRFFGFEGEYFQVEISDPAFSAMVRVYAYTHAAGIADLFEIMSKNWKGWLGEKNWSSIEGEFSITATSDKLGHISLAIEMHHGLGVSEPWDLNATIIVEAGQLASIAQDAENFFKK